MTTKLTPLQDLLKRKGVVIAAHRGASGYAPENTLAAYNLAMEMGANAIELDVHLSKEGIPVIIHDHRLERTTSGRGLVQDHSADELKALDIGSWFHTKFSSERIFTLEEILQWAKGRTSLLIEIKNNPMKYGEIASKVLDSIQKHGMAEYVEVFSFDHGLVKEVKAIRPEILTGVCYMADPVSHADLAIWANADVVHPHFSYCTPEAVKEARNKGIFVTTWTVNDMEIARRLIDMGMDCIKTDFPDKLREVVEST